jgi:hypothetical protein
VQLGWSRHQGRDCLQISGWPAAGPAVGAPGLTVVPAELLARQATDHPSMAGEVVVVDGGVRFIPRHPFVAGLEYAVMLAGAAGRDGPLFIRRPSDEATPIGEVLQIHPTVEVLPRNQLRFYVHFSVPMSEGFAPDSITLRRADSDEAIPDALLMVGPELWDRGRRRLTLLLDPGRIKRGLVPNTETGYALTEGSNVALSVDARLPDAQGQPLRAGRRREYRVGPDIRRRVQPDQWTVLPPPGGSSEPLVVALDRPLDHALLGRCLQVLDASGHPVPGRLELARDDIGWSFRPTGPWNREPYRILVEAHLEDLAGNSVTRVFDRDLDAAGDAPTEGAPVTIGFTCR